MLFRLGVTLILCALALLVVAGEEAYVIERYDVSVDLSGNTIHETIVITLAGPSPPSDYVYLFAYPLSNVNVYDREGPLPFSPEGDALIIALRALPNTPYTFTMEFDTEGYVQEMEKGRWVFSPTFSFDVSVRKFTLTVSAPKTYSFESPIHPDPTSFFSSKDVLSAQWEKDELAPSEEVFIIVNFKRVAPEEGGTSPLMYVLGALLLASLSFGAGFITGRKVKKIREVYFVGDEKAILDAIREEGGKVIQSTLTKKTNFSKAKISKILSELEQRGIIQKDKYKRTNVIILKEPL